MKKQLKKYLAIVVVVTLICLYAIAQTSIKATNVTATNVNASTVTTTGASTIDGIEASAPASPAASHWVLYPKTSTGWCEKNSSGTETCIGAATPSLGLSFQIFSATGGQSPASATTYYVGPIGAGVKTSVGSQNPLYIPAACTIVNTTYYVNIGGTLDSVANNFTLSLDKNSGTDLADTHVSIPTNAAVTTTNDTSSDAVVAGDLIRLKVVTPTFGTAPTTVSYGATINCK